MCRFSSVRLEATLLVKWNVDYLAVAVRRTREYCQLCWCGKPGTDDRDGQAHCWVLRDRALRALILLGRSPHRTTRTALLAVRIRDVHNGIGTARTLRTA